MKTSKNNLIAILAMCAAVLAANDAPRPADSSSAVAAATAAAATAVSKSTFSGNSSSHNQFKNGSNHQQLLISHHGITTITIITITCDYIEPVRLVYSQCYHPQFRCCYVYPGDNWYSISKRVYGVDFLCKHIASYNGLSMNSPLVPGQMLRLPVVNANGSLAVSNAPMPAPFAPQGIPFARARALSSARRSGFARKACHGLPRKVCRTAWLRKARRRHRPAGIPNGRHDRQLRSLRKDRRFAPLDSDR